jgi:LacI family transcriptional regulator
MAGVSTATVSRVLNNKAIGNMRPETFERIKNIIKATNYTPHALASGLRKGTTNVIGVIFPDNVNPYYAQLGNSIEREAFSHGFLTLICNSSSDMDREREYIKHLISQRVTGILLCSTGLSGREVVSLTHDKCRLILLDEDVDNFGGDVVIGDDHAGGSKGAEYLFTLGHSRILVVTGPEKLNSIQYRLQGFLDYANAVQAGYDLNLVLRGDFTIDSAYRAVSSAIKKGLAFSAVFAFNDLMAIGAIKALADHGHSVPRDISVLGYDNIFIDELMNPKITTVATSLDRLGKYAVQKLIEQPAAESSRVLIEPEILVRESCLPRRNDAPGNAAGITSDNS